MKYHIKIWLPVHLAFSFLIIFVSPLTHAQENIDLKNQLAKELKNQDLTGAVWSIVKDGEIYTDAWGIKNFDEQTKLNPDDLVHVGSVSKTILAAGFLRMATLGLLSLDDPVKKYLPNLPIENQWDDTNPITIRQLLDHTSGLTNAKLWHIFSTSAKPDTPLESVYINNPNILKVQARPGSIYSYSNLGYTILGMVIEKVTQTRYENYLDDNLLKPLGMKNSTFHFISQIGKNADKNLAFGHFDKGKPVPAMPMYLRPAGQLTTNAEDMGKFLHFMMSDGTINGKPFIKSEYLSLISKQKQTDAYKNGVPFGDALGAYSRDRYGVVGISKIGNILGFSSRIYLFPNERKAFFIAYNIDSETANYDLFNEKLVKHLGLKTQQFITTQQNVESELNDWNGYYVPVITKVEPFGLLDNVFAHAKVEISENGALLTPFQGRTKILMYQGKNLFSMKDRTNISHSLYKKEGKFYFSDGINTYEKINRFFLFFLWFSFFAGLAGIVFTLVRGLKALFSKGTSFIQTSIAIPFLAIVLLVLPIPFFFLQSFISLGDITVASVLAALVTFILPFGFLYGMWREFRLMKSQRKFRYDFLALLSVIQLLLVLYYYGLIPFLLWA